jgi:putative endonuclease
MEMDPRQLGKAGEDLAARVLKQQGYKILERNYRTPLGEIDLVARHQGDLVFIEVRTRRSLRFGTPLESLSFAKQQRLRRLAEYYVKRRKLPPTAMRLDVVAIIWDAAGPQVEIIQGAL